MMDRLSSPAGTPSRSSIGEAEALLDGVELGFDLLLQVFDERLHVVVVDELADHGLLEVFAEVVGVGGRDVALGRCGQQDVARRDRPRRSGR